MNQLTIDTPTTKNNHRRQQCINDRLQTLCYTRTGTFNDPEAAVIIAHGQHKRIYREESMDADGLLQYIEGAAAGAAAVQAGKQDAWTAASIANVPVLDDAAAEPSDPSLPQIPCVFDPAQACVDGPVDQPERRPVHTRVYNAML